MTPAREALVQTLIKADDAWGCPNHLTRKYLEHLADAILSRMGGEPVAWRYEIRCGVHEGEDEWMVEIEPGSARPDFDNIRNCEPLYASPPAPAPDARMVEALRPFAAISLVRDHDPDGSDMIDAPDLSITPNDVRRARDVLATRADQGK
jgi:hypothetical protein